MAASFIKAPKNVLEQLTQEFKQAQLRNEHFVTTKTFWVPNKNAELVSGSGHLVLVAEVYMSGSRETVFQARSQTPELIRTSTGIK